MRVNPRRIIGAAAIALLTGAPAVSAQDASGLWDAVIVANKVDVPFRFEVAVKGTAAEGFFFEGDTRVGSTSGTYQNGALRLEYDFLNTVLEASFDGTSLKGTYKNNRPNARPQEFRAQRFRAVDAAPGPAQVDGSWAMYKSGENRFKLDVSWRLYLRESDGAVSGAILRTSGDTGTLTGRWSNGTLVMSHFAGERPLLFEAKPNPDGTLAVTLDRESTFIAARTSEAREKGIPEPPDLSRFTSVKDPSERFRFSGVDVNGTAITESDPRFQGKVVILAIGGTWCPNCHDEMPTLLELDREFRAAGLQIAGLFFESDADLAVAKPRVAAFVRRHKVDFPIIVAGNRDEGQAKLPQLNNFAVFPTTVFLGRDGRVRSVHAGFASPATGDEHTRLKNEYRDTVKRLLAEAGATASVQQVQ